MCAQLSLGERQARGSEAAAAVPPQAHRGWEPAAGRRSPVEVLAEQEADRLSDLVPVRHGRMMISPFTFYRGAAAVMAEDLRATPVAGLPAQLCGDAHLSNFGVFGSPERRLVFDLNDFDETLPGPFEYDVKRMVASFVIAARDNGFCASDAKDAARAAAAAYRTAMSVFAQLGTMDVWYASLDEDTIRSVVRDTMESIGQAKKSAKKGKKKERAREQAKMAKRAAKRAARAAEKAHTRDSMQALSKLGEAVGDSYRIVSQPPVLIPLRELAFDMAPEMTPGQIEEGIRDQFRAYRATLQPDRRHLLEQYEMVDAARKVVGVGSVGTRAYIVLLQGRDASDPLFLQIKEATSSVLEGHLPRSRYRQHGQRVVHGQRLMQAASDIYLGWTRGPRGRDFYWRQLRDMKGSAEIEAMTPLGLNAYARACGWTLARAHARSGDPVAIAAYLGESDEFDRSVTDFAVRYADQNERDFAEFVAAIKSGGLTAVEGVLSRLASHPPENEWPSQLSVPHDSQWPVARNGGAVAGPDHGGGAPHRKHAVLLVLRHYGGQMALLRRFALPGMLLPALGSTGISYVAPLIVAALIGRLSARGAVTAGEAAPYVLGFAGLLLFSEVFWRIGLHCMNRLDGRAIENLSAWPRCWPSQAPPGCPACWPGSAPRGPAGRTPSRRRCAWWRAWPPGRTASMT